MFAIIDRVLVFATIVLFALYLRDIDLAITENGERIAALEQQVGTLGQQVGDLGQRVGALEQRFGAFEEQVGTFEERMTAELRRLTAQVNENVRQIEAIKVTLADIRTMVGENKIAIEVHNQLHRLSLGEITRSSKLKPAKSAN